MKILISLTLILFASGISPRTYANCGSSSCPIDHHSYIVPGMFRIGLTYENVRMDQLQVGSGFVKIGNIPLPVHHEELETFNQRSVVTADYGVSGRLSFSLLAPYVAREHSHLHEGEVEHWSFSGVGDVMLHGTYVLSQSMDPDLPYLAVTAGIKLPTGATSKANTEGEEAEVTIQPGSGSYDGVVSLSSRYVAGTMKSLSGEYSTIPISASLSARFNGKGKGDYRVGNEIVGSLGSSFALDPRIALQLQVNARYQGHGDMGSTDEFRAYTGGEWIFLTPGISSEVFASFNLFLFVQIPLYQNVNGVQQVSSTSLQTGISYSGIFF